MSYNLIIKEGARLDMSEAYQYYELQQPGLGDRFLSELEKRFISISEHPEYYSYIDNKQLLRDVIIGSFPYVVVYAIINDEVRVYAICPHTNVRGVSSRSNLITANKEQPSL